MGTDGHKGESVLEGGLYFPDKSWIAYEILAYLMDHPDAQDTLEGVMEWWLLERKLKYESRRVRELLSEFVARGFILERENKYSRVHYKINPDKKSEIRTLLDQLQPTAEKSSR